MTLEEMTPKQKAMLKAKLKELYLAHKRDMRAFSLWEQFMPPNKLPEIPGAVTVHWQGESIPLFPEIAAQWDLHEGDHLTSVDQRDLVKIENNQFGLAQCQLELDIRTDFDPEVREVEK
jgi:hypothetical protein